MFYDLGNQPSKSQIFAQKVYQIAISDQDLTVESISLMDLENLAMDLENLADESHHQPKSPDVCSRSWCDYLTQGCR